MELYLKVPTTPACTWWNRPEKDPSSGKLGSTHPSKTVIKSIEFFYGVESVVRGNADSLLNWRTIGAHKMASIDHLHQEFLTLKVKHHSDMLSAQYLVNCLEEDHVCGGITTQEPRHIPMKEILHSRHQSTVLPRIGASRKESLRNLHTHSVDSDTKLLGNNRVLKERQPPIADEEQRLNRRQRCTLSIIVSMLFSAISIILFYVIYNSCSLLSICGKCMLYMFSISLLYSIVYTESYFF